MAKPTPACYSRDQIVQFAKGDQTTEVESAAIASHLTECSICREVFDTVPDIPVGGLLFKAVCRLKRSVNPHATTWFDAPPPLVLRHHPKWELLRCLGRGGMGVVYLARHRYLQELNGDDQFRAVKIIQISLTGREHHKQRSLTELRAVAGLPPHPHLVRGYEIDVDATETLLLLVMEYVPGKNLGQAAREQPQERFPIEQACGFVLQALCGLDFAARHGIVAHRDLKPENLMLSDEGVIKVADFGLAKIRFPQSDPTNPTQGGQQGCGSLAYTAPEQIEDLTCADVRSDLYSLGCTLYRLIAGQPPFGEHNGCRTPQALWHAHQSSTPTALNRVAAGVPLELSRLVDQLLNKKPHRRLQNLRDFAARLVPFVPNTLPAAVAAWVRELPQPVNSPRRWRDQRLLLTIPAAILCGGLLVWTTWPVSEALPTDPALPTIDENIPAIGPSLPPVSDWKPYAPTPAELKSFPNMKYADGVFQGIDPQDSEIEFTSVQARDQSIRAKLKIIDPTENTVPNIALHLRRSESGFYTCWFHPGHVAIGMNRNNQYVDLALTDNSAKPGELVELTFTALGDDLTALLNGETVLTVKNRAFAEGSPGLELYRCLGEIHDVELKIPAANTKPSEHPPSAVAPFNAKMARTYQQAWAEHLRVPVEWENSIGMKFVLIPPGEFWMGSTPEEIDEALEEIRRWKQPNEEDYAAMAASEAPQHQVILTEPFYLQTQELTQAQYTRMTGKTWYYYSAVGDGRDIVEGIETKDFPADFISWNDAMRFCVKLSDEEQLTPTDLAMVEGQTRFVGNGYRLPTEAEWEFAARAGTRTKFWCGTKDAELFVSEWTAATSGGRPHPVGRLKSNPFGLYDMLGNQMEWVFDARDPDYYAKSASSPAIDPKGPDPASPVKMFRGGSFGNNGYAARPTFRNWMSSPDVGSVISLRLVISVAGVQLSEQRKGDGGSPQ